MPRPARIEYGITTYTCGCSVWGPQPPDHRPHWEPCRMHEHADRMLAIVRLLANTATLSPNVLTGLQTMARAVARDVKK